MEYSPPNRPPGTLNLPQTLSTTFGTSVGGSPREMGLVGPAMGAGAPWVQPHPSWAQPPHLWWVNSIEVCDMAYNGLAQS
jgi:hypothetical protein